MKKSLKGFTLVELIIVMAIFSILMVGVMSLIDPVSKIMSRATLQEANTAAVDNMKRYFEGTLRYADAIVTCEGDLSEYDGTNWVAISGTDEQVKMEKAVTNFLTDYYTDRTAPSSDATTATPLSGKVHVLKINNDNGGKIEEYTWDFTSGYSYLTQSVPGSGTFDVSNIIPPTISNYSGASNAINDVYYENYSYYIGAGYNELDTISSLSDGSPTPVALPALTKNTEYYGLLTPIRKADGTTYTAYDPISNPSGARFSKDMFSLSIVTYKTADGQYRTSDDPSTIENDAEVFKAPFAISNATMSLVNITSSYASNTKYYGPVRYSGTDASGTYTPTTMVDKKTNDTVTTPDGKWDYKEIVLGADRCNPHPRIDGNNIYFIYTLPNAA